MRRHVSCFTFLKFVILWTHMNIIYCFSSSKFQLFPNFNTFKKIIADWSRAQHWCNLHFHDQSNWNYEIMVSWLLYSRSRIILTFCLIRTIVYFPIDLDMWIIHTFCVVCTIFRVFLCAKYPLHLPPLLPVIFNVAVHAAVIAINEAIEHQVPENTLHALNNPAAHLNNMYDDLADMYQNVLYDAKQNKAEIARNKVN